MTEPFLGEVRMFSFGFAPRGWATCDGQLLPINQNQALFSLLGTVYGGDGRTNFALPDLRGRTSLHYGGGFTQGQRGGEEVHTLSVSEMPTHVHTLNGSSANASSANPAGNVPARATDQIYRQLGAQSPMGANSLSVAGGNQPHENRQPYLVINFCIALQGIFPSQN